MEELDGTSVHESKLSDLHLAAFSLAIATICAFLVTRQFRTTETLWSQIYIRQLQHNGGALHSCKVVFFRSGLVEKYDGTEMAIFCHDEAILFILVITHMCKREWCGFDKYSTYTRIQHALLGHVIHSNFLQTVTDQSKHFPCMTDLHLRHTQSCISLVPDPVRRPPFYSPPPRVWKRPHPKPLHGPSLTQTN